MNDLDIIDAEIVEDEPIQLTIVPDEELTERQRQLNKVKKLVAFFEAHPEFELPNELIGSYSFFNVMLYSSGDKGVTEGAEIVKAYPAQFKKNDPKKGGLDEEYLMLTEVTDEPGPKLKVWVSRERVCTPVVVGKETKKVKKLVTEAVYEEVDEEVDVKDFECGSLLSAAAQIQLSKLEEIAS